MNANKRLKQGRQAFQQQSWSDAYKFLSAADNKNPLGTHDLEQLAKAAYLIGRESEYIDLLSRAHHQFLNKDDTPKAINCAFWLGMILFNQGEHAQGSGWFARAGRLIDEYGQQCVQQGFLLIPEALQCLRQDDPENAFELFSKAGEIGNQFNNPDLLTFSRLGSGQALIHQGKITNGTTLLDEAMVAVVSDETSPIVAGIVYCAVIETCQKIYDLQRAREWTDALSRWCDSQPDLIPYRGQCLVRRAEIMQLQGKWPVALQEAQQACNLPRPSHPSATGEAFYRQAELYRLQGQFSHAENAYHQASKWGRNPQPGFALLRLAQGEVQAAKTAIQHIAKETANRMARANILPAFIEIMLEAAELQSAEDSADELAGIAAELDSPFLIAIAEQSTGNVLLRKSKPREAIKKLRHCWQLFNKVEARYESARTQRLMGLAYLKLNDHDTAKIEISAARAVFQQLGATTDIHKVDSLIPKHESDKTHGLTPRELEVLQILATGKTNKEIANELFISERTVDRHVSNILGKFGVDSRAAATAYAYEHDMI
ncbi:LuxR C-terminal-related transcriptional regulator [Fodinibius salsisoli]|nr:helix-turn-helix transcriptional regulator [Fodinibius salsisoli]